MQKILLVTELVLLFIVVPLLFYFNFIPGHKSIPLLLVFIYCLTILLRDKSFERKKFVDRRFRGFSNLMKRFAITAVVLTIYLLIFEPENLFIIPRQMPWLWAAIMVFYPLWSALPQELIFRVSSFTVTDRSYPVKKCCCF